MLCDEIATRTSYSVSSAQDIALCLMFSVMCIPDVTLPRLKAFIPQLLSRLHIEALLHGNIPKEVCHFFFLFILFYFFYKHFVTYTSIYTFF